MKFNFDKLQYLFVLNLIYTFSTAQPAIDTIKYSLKQKPGIFGKIDSRNSFIDNNRAVILGFKAGLDYNDKLKFGLGYNLIYPRAKKFDKKVYFINSNNINDSTIASIHLNYFSFHTEFIYYQTKRWEFSIPLLIGVGQTYYKYSYLGEKYKIEKSAVFIYEPAVSVEYKISKWIGVGTGVGFRFMATNSNLLNRKFTSPTYAFKLLIYYNELMHLFINKKSKPI